MKRKTLTCAIMVAISALFVITEVKAQLQCKTPGGITVTAQPKSTDTSGNIVWDFFVDGNSQMLNSVKDVVLVIRRPVAPADIVSPLPVRTYCDQSDTNTRINRGNCDGFPLISIPLTPISSTRLRARVITSPTVTEGLVTPTIVTGASNSEVCTATVGGVLTGILGPGEIGDPFQPIFKQQTSMVAGGKCEAKLTFDSKGRLELVETSTPGCTVTTGDVFIDGQLLRNNTNPHGITWGNGTCTSYGPPIPSPSRTICK